MSFRCLLPCILFLHTSLLLAMGEVDLRATVSWLDNRTVVLEWDATPGEIYEVTYSSNLIHWKNAVSGQVIAPVAEGRVQWTDTSPQLPESEFNETGDRFYRIIRKNSTPQSEEISILFQPNEGPPVSAFRGSFMVPENRANPASREISVSYVRFPSTSASPSSPIVYLAGGPGGVGEEEAGVLYAFVSKLREVADVIAFNQRGTGPTNDIPPYESNHKLPQFESLTLENSVPPFRAATAEAAEFWKQEGIDLSGYNTLESARDLEDLRRVLGTEKITLWGGSYGSHLAIATVREMQDRVDRVILESIEGLHQTVKLPSSVDDYFDRLQAAINTQPAAAQAFPDLKGLMRRVHSQYENTPVEASVQDEGETVRFFVGKTELQFFASSIIDNPESAVNLPIIYRSAEAGNLSSVAPLIFEALREPRLELLGMREAMDTMSGISNSRLAIVREQAQTALLGDILNFQVIHVTDALGLDVLGESFRAQLITDVPTIAFSSTLDGNTPYVEASEALAGFSNLKHVTLKNAGHNDFLFSPIIHEMVVDFLRGNEVENELEFPLPQFPN